MSALPPLDVPEERILNLLAGNPDSETARALSAALKISINEISPDNPFGSQGPDYLISRFSRKLDLDTLNKYQVVLSKREGCEILRQLGVRDISDKYLNRYIDAGAYRTEFGRGVSKCQGRGNGKLVLTYGEIVYFFTKVLKKAIPNPLPPFPDSLSIYATEGEQLFP